MKEFCPKCGAVTYCTHCCASCDETQHCGSCGACYPNGTCGSVCDYCEETTAPAEENCAEYDYRFQGA